MTQPTFSEILQTCTDRCRTMDAPLAERLQSFANDVGQLSPEFAAIVARMVERLQSVSAGQSAPAPGERMPGFVLPDQNGHLVSLDRLLENSQAVISFHRGHWCPYCRINADALAKIEPEVSAAGGQIIAITPELQQFNRELQADAGASFPVLSDIDNAYALELNLVIQIPDDKRRAMTAAGWDIANYVNDDSWMLPIPATFVVGRDGMVKARFVDPDYRRRMDIDDILAALRNV